MDDHKNARTTASNRVWIARMVLEQGLP